MKQFAFPWASFENHGALLLKWAVLKRSMRHIGKGAFVSPFAQLTNMGHISVGARSQICRGTLLQAIVQYGDRRYDPELTILDDVYVGRGCTISCATRVIIEPFVTLGDYVYVADSMHGFSDKDRGVLQQPLIDGEVAIGARAWIGYGAVVAGNIRIGEHAIVGAQSVVRKSVEPFTMVVGAPARVIKRYDFNTKSWVPA